VGERTRKILARRPKNEDTDLAIRSEGGSEQVAEEISFVSSQKMTLGRTAIALHEELPITLTWRANYQMLRSEQSTGGSTLVVYLFGGEIRS
jgi:hypothetical protein